MAEIFFSDEAINDIKKIKEYISVDLCNSQAAADTVEKILKDVRRLSVFPRSGSSLQTIINTETEYKYTVSGNYIIFYKNENDAVKIIRILYGKRDYLRILFDTAIDK